MHTTNLEIVLTSIKTFDEYEKLKLNLDILEYVAKEIIERHKLPDAPLTLFSEGTNIVFAYGDQKVIKIYPSFHQEQFQNELLVMQHLQGKVSANIPLVEYEGEIFGWPYIVMSQLEGTLLETLWENMGHANKIIIIRELGSLIKEVHSLSTHGLEVIDCHWKDFIATQIDSCIEKHRTTKLPELLLKQIPEYIESIKATFLINTQPVILTGEYTPMNFLVCR